MKKHTLLSVFSFGDPSGRLLRFATQDYVHQGKSVKGVRPAGLDCTTMNSKNP